MMFFRKSKWGMIDLSLRAEWDGLGLGRSLGGGGTLATLPGKGEMGFIAAEGAEMGSLTGGVRTFFVGVTADVPGATERDGGFGGDDVSVEVFRMEGVAVLERSGSARSKCVSLLGADEAHGG